MALTLFASDYDLNFIIWTFEKNCSKFSVHEAPKLCAKHRNRFIRGQGEIFSLILFIIYLYKIGLNVVMATVYLMPENVEIFKQLSRIVTISAPGEQRQYKS